MHSPVPPVSPATTLRVLRITLQCRSPIADEVEHPFPLVIRKLARTLRYCEPRRAIRRVEIRRQRQASPDAARAHRADASPDSRDSIAPLFDSVARTRHLHQLQRVRRQHTSPCSLHPGDARCARRAGEAARFPSDCRSGARGQPARNRRRGRDCDVATTQRSVRSAARPPPIPALSVERPMMQRDRARPVGTRRENRLIPDLSLRPGIREHDRSLAFLDRIDHLRHHLRSEMPGPRKAFDHRRYKRVDNHFLRFNTANNSRIRHIPRRAMRSLPRRDCRLSPKVPTSSGRDRCCGGARARARV